MSPQKPNQYLSQVLDIIVEIEWASDLKLSMHENEVSQKMKELGLER